MGYRKLTEEELKKYGFSRKNNQIVSEYVRKYYPQEAASALVMATSEYNDSTYDVHGVTIIVFDKNQNELTPLKDCSISARKDMPCPYQIYPNNSDYDGYTERDLEDFVVFLDVPELYIKE